MTSYIPPRDADFALWLDNLNTVSVASGVATYGMTAGNVTAITAQNTAFQAAFMASSDPATRGPATVAAKDSARAMAELVVRPICVIVSQNPAISNIDKVTLGVTVRSGTVTPVPPPVTSPNVTLRSAQTNILNLDYRDSANPLPRSKPAGVVAVELVGAFGTVPATDPSQCLSLGLFTKTPLQVSTAGKAGKLVTIFARYMTRSGPGGASQVGPFGAPLNTIAI